MSRNCTEMLLRGPPGQLKTQSPDNPPLDALQTGTVKRYRTKISIETGGQIVW